MGNPNKKSGKFKQKVDEIQTKKQLISEIQTKIRETQT
jgi:hypothetical protein